MPGFNDQIKKIAAARNATELAEQALYQAKIAAQKTLKSTQFADVEKSIGPALLARDQAQKALLDALKEMFPANKAYEALTANLSSALPILMLPVHIETRFFDVPGIGNKRQLLVRIMQMPGGVNFAPMNLQYQRLPRSECRFGKSRKLVVEAQLLKLLANHPQVPDVDPAANA